MRTNNKSALILIGAICGVLVFAPVNAQQVHTPHVVQPAHGILESISKSPSDEPHE